MSFKATCRACPSPNIPMVTTSSAAIADTAVTGSATHDSNSCACKASAVSAQLPAIQSSLIRPGNGGSNSSVCFCSRRPGEVSDLADGYLLSSALL